MKTIKLPEYTDLLTKAYYSNWEDLSVNEELLKVKPEFTIDDFLYLYAFNNQMFVFQNPTIPDIVNEFKDHDFYKQYKSGNTKMFGALIGQIMKKYQSCNIDMVRNLLV